MCMRACMCVCMCVCVRVCVCESVCVRMWVCVVCMHVCVCVRVRAGVYVVCARDCMWVCESACVRLCECMCVHVTCGTWCSCNDTSTWNWQNNGFLFCFTILNYHLITVPCDHVGLLWRNQERHIALLSRVRSFLIIFMCRKCFHWGCTSLPLQHGHITKYSTKTTFPLHSLLGFHSQLIKQVR